ATTVNAGTLKLASGGSLGSTSALTVNGGTFDLENGGQTVGSLAGTGGAVTLGNGRLTINQSITTTFLGHVSGTGGRTKSGDGTLIVDGVNNYTGGTEIDGGTLMIGDADHPTASIGGSITVGAKGTLAGHGTLAAGASVDNSAGGTV